MFNKEMSFFGAYYGIDGVLLLTRNILNNITFNVSLIIENCKQLLR